VLQPISPALDPSPDAAASPDTYVVVRGDTLIGIARKLDVSLRDLMQANGLSKNAIIRPGQPLKIPDGGNLQLGNVPQAQVAVAVDNSLQTQSHTVASGDTLSGLAQRYGTTVAAIRAANGLTGNMIRVGQDLLIPEGSRGASVTSVEPGSRATSSQVSSGQGASGQTYTVQKGDTLGAIAFKYDTTVKALQVVNNIDNPRALQVGQVLRLPGAASVQTQAAQAPEASAEPQPAQAPADDPESWPMATPQADEDLDMDTIPMARVIE
jgi:LysM repeat protein